MLEDLTLYDAFGREENITLQTFQKLVRQDIVHRSEESIRSRYRYYLAQLTSADLAVIFKYIQDN